MKKSDNIVSPWILDQNNLYSSVKIGMTNWENSSTLSNQGLAHILQDCNFLPNYAPERHLCNEHHKTGTNSKNRQN